MAAVCQSVLQSAKRLSGLGLTRVCRQISPMIIKKVTVTSTLFLQTNRDLVILVERKIEIEYWLPRKETLYKGSQLGY